MNYAKLLSVLLMFLCGPALAAPIWYVNTNGLAQKYTISRFEGENPVPGSPVIWPNGSGFDAVHIAWPSAVTVGSEVWVYASGYNGSTWGGIGLWKSSDGISFIRHGAVFTAGLDEPNGIGMSQVSHDPTDAAAPFKMWYSIRSPSGPASAIGYATSSDGEFWVRQGIVMSASGVDEAAGITVDNVCQRSNGDWVLFYSSFSSLTKAAAKIAISSTPGGAFGGKQTIMSPDNVSVSILTGAVRRSTVLSVSSPSSINEGQSYVITGGPQSEVEVVTVEEKDGDLLRLSAPLSYSQAGRTLNSLQKNKISPSWVRENPDGTWSGIFTSFGVANGILSEYTYPVKADSLTGVWTLDLDNTSPSHEPWAPQMWFSTENPSLLGSGVSC